MEELWRLRWIDGLVRCLRDNWGWVGIMGGGGVGYVYIREV